MTEPFSTDPTPVGSRHAILVDVGYLYAAVGLLVLGTTSRRAFRVGADSLITSLIERAAKRVPGELLRVYWYDAARDRVPTVEQRQIAALPHVKVRLGNLNTAGQQKGVDAQVRQDLEVLARHRAVTDVVLLAGDEDMVSAVEAAQAFGVRVHVWGVEPPYGVNQAERLVWEADTVDELDAEFCRPYVTLEPGAAVTRIPAGAPDGTGVMAAPSSGRPIVPTPADVFAGRRPAPAPARLGPDRQTMEEIGEHIAGKWLVTRGRDNVADLLPGPVLPTVIDKELLVEAEQYLNRSLRPYEDARRALRDGFWARLHREFGLTVGVSGQVATPPAPEAR
jgi:NYN domain